MFEMENTKKRVKVKALFPMRKEQQIYANLESFEWDCTSHGFVYLCFNDEKIKMNYIGQGNVKGILVLVLTLADTRYSLVEDVCNIKKNEIFIERDLQETQGSSRLP